MLAYMAIYQFMSLPLLLLVKQFWPELLSETWFNLILNEVIQYGIALPVAVLIMNSAKAPKPQEVRPQRKYRLSAGEFVHYLILSIGLLFLFNIVGTYLNYLISLVKGSQAGNIVEQSLTSYSIPQAFLLTVISAPIGEELLFRKCIFRAVGCYGEKAFLFTSASLFMLMHGNVIQYPYAFAVGLVFGWVYLRTGSIWYSIFLHAIVNFVGGILPLLGEDVPAIMVGLSILYLVSSGYAIWIIWRKRYFRVRNKPELLEGALDAALINPGMMLFTVASFVMAGYIILYL